MWLIEKESLGMTVVLDLYASTWIDLEVGPIIGKRRYCSIYVVVGISPAF